MILKRGGEVMLRIGGLTGRGFYDIKHQPQNIYTSSTSNMESAMTPNRTKFSVLALAFLLFAAAGPAHALQVGDKAPEFELNSSKGGKLKLSDLRGKNVLINFYRNDFDPT